MVHFTRVLRHVVTLDILSLFAKEKRDVKLATEKTVSMIDYEYFYSKPT